MPSDTRTRVVIVGGGFAGVACAKRLAGEPTVTVTLVDRTGFQEFQPLLYQVATAELTPHDVRFDLSYQFREAQNIEVRVGTVTGIDPHTRTVSIDGDRDVTGDIVVVAAGAQPNFFGIPGAPEYAVPLYSLDDAERIRSRVLDLVAKAAHGGGGGHGGGPTGDGPNGRDLVFVVVGGGPTGVETAGALAELVHDVLPYAHPGLSHAHAEVVLVDRGSDVLAPFSVSARQYAAAELRRRGVRLLLGAGVTRVDPDAVRLSDGSSVAAALVIWAGGESASAVVGASSLPYGRGGRVDVLEDLTVPGHPEVYVVGDAANIRPADRDPLPQLGSVAQQSGDWAAQNILAGIEHLGQPGFGYRDKGILAMIGRKAAVAELGEHRHELRGRFAFAAWLGVHAELLATTGARVNAFVSWAEEFYLRPHHRSAELLDPALVDTPRIAWND